MCRKVSLSHDSNIFNRDYREVGTRKLSCPHHLLLTYFLFLFPLVLSTRHIPAARPRSQRTLGFPGAGHGQGPLPRDRESPCHSHWASFCAAWYPPVKDAPRRTDSLETPCHIALPCGRTDMIPAAVLVPIVQPISKWHIRLEPARLLLLTGFLQSFELLQTVRFCLRQDTVCFRVALVIVADDIASLPAPICSQADAAGPVFSSCHGFSSSPRISVRKLPATVEAYFCISPVTWV